MTFKKTLIAIALLLTFSLTVTAASDCRQQPAEPGPGEWVVTQGGEWPAIIEARDEYHRGLQLVVRGKVCNADGDALPEVQLQLVRYERVSDEGTMTPRFADLSDGGSNSFKVIDRFLASRDDTGTLRAAIKPGNYALIPLDTNDQPIMGRLLYDLRVIQGFATAQAYGDLSTSR